MNCPPFPGVRPFRPVQNLAILRNIIHSAKWLSRFSDRFSDSAFREKITGEVPDETIFTIFVELDRFDKSWEACEIARFSPEKKLKYESDMMTERDYYNIIDTARHEGEAKGLSEGKAEATAAIARALLSTGMDITQIASVTGLSVEEIKTL